MTVSVAEPVGPVSDRRSPVVVAIDGPSGSGKSSVSRAVARTLGLAYLDTGAMYRALTWWGITRHISADDQDAVRAMLSDVRVDLSNDPTENWVRVVERETGISHDVTAEIRSLSVSQQVSAYAVIPQVRTALRAQQRELIAEARGSSGMVVEGRDITTVVAPDAEVRILLTADTRARLQRRTLEATGTATETAMAAHRDVVVRRDQDDATVSTFDRPAPGVHVVDSSTMDFKQTVAAVLAVVTAVRS